MDIVKIKVADLIEYENNPRFNDEAVEPVAESIKQFGFKVPIIVDKNNVIITGHTRKKAAQLLQLEEVPCIVADDLTPEKIQAFRLADNKTAEFAQWDMDKLNEELSQLTAFDIDMNSFGFDFDFDMDLDNEAEKDNFDIETALEEIEEPKTKLGDVYQLGNHRLMCGDSTKKEDVQKLMDGDKAQMTFSDAPYNISFKGSMSNTTVNGVMVKHKGANQRHDAINNDCMSREEFYEFMCNVLFNIKNNVLGAWYLSFSSINLDELLNPLRDNEMNWKSIIIWMKNQATLSMKDYKSRYEPIVYGRFDDIFYGEKAKEEDIWEYQRTLKNDLHPTMKPIPLICNMLNMSSKKNDIVLDLFGGSGSTLIACEQLERTCYMMEYEPKYCDVIIKRWEEYTGKKVEKIV